MTETGISEGWKATKLNTGMPSKWVHFFRDGKSLCRGWSWATSFDGYIDIEKHVKCRECRGKLSTFEPLKRITSERLTELAKKRELVIQIRVNDAEKELIRAAADLDGMTMLGWIRDRLRKMAVQETLK